ncbi:nck-associated protein 5-like isoform X1 [Astyanax mexicanus]|uniref:Nck-associated protein 5-like isoform X1 n=1 Tax=Astyanax mexicanus TaxID=7994 RepID=A0A8T2LBP5_ASTMX|nr:nck-associated protein 5-like isoform X1 [Astyanax mexicanus]
MMTEEAEHRALEEDLESEEGDLESYLEEESSSELLERVRELQAENSALSLANESQREAYERCLDEVANHVVQALLNQKDLREECIKLKMRVFDLERQNRTLCELLQEKLHNQSCVHQQTGSCLEHIAELQHSDTNKLLETQRNAQAKGNGECAQNCLPDTQSSATSMEALSPFLKKKAHILEVLRKLEETDPLRYHRSSGISSLCEYSQALVSKESVLACRDNSPRCSVMKTHCPHSCPDVCTHQHLNGGDHNSVKCGSCNTCLMLSNKDSISLANSSHNCCTANSITIDNLNLAPPEFHKNQDLQSLVKPAAGTSELVANRKSTDVSVPPAEQGLVPSTQLALADLTEAPDSYLNLTVAEKDHNVVPDYTPANPLALTERETRDKNRMSDVLVDDQLSKRSSSSVCDELVISDETTNNASHLEKDYKHLTAAVASQKFEEVAGSEEKVTQKEDTDEPRVQPTTSKLPALSLKDSLQDAYCELESGEPVHKGLLFSPNENHTASRVLDDICAPVKDSTAQELQADRSKLVSPNQVSCLREVKASPSKLLKFLKIPTLGDRAPAANAPRLSPQLTRSSKIPCRSNNYEVHHSPVAVRKATTTERQKQPPCTKSEPYPSTHSAPTSPPQPDDPPPVVPKELNCGIAKSSRSGKPTQIAPPQKNAQKVPLYENVSDLSHTSAAADISQVLGEVSTALRYVSSNTERVKGKIGSNFGAERPLSLKSQKDTSLGSDSSSDQEENSSDNPVWHKHGNHRSLPSQSSSQKSQSSGISMRSRSQEKNEVAKEHTQTAASPAKRNDPPPIPKKTGLGRQSGESSHSFKERLAALGKLRNPEEPSSSTQPAEKKEIQSTLSATSVSVLPRTSDNKSKTADRNSDCKAGEHRLSKNADSVEEKSFVSGHLDSALAKQQGQFQLADQAIRSLPASAVISKLETESSRLSLAKPESPKSKMPPPSANLETAQALRTYVKSATPHSLSYGGKNVSSPNKIPLKSPTKTVPPSLSRESKPTQEIPRYLSKSEDRSQLRSSKKKNSFGESLPPPPPRPVESAEEKRHSTPSPQSSIEQKVMKGIEENMLKLQEQDKGQVPEVKQKASNGIANWFGLRKSKLPALSRKPEPSKGKDEKREWKLNISSVGKDSKAAAKKPESESLNISMLMEKAEGLHKALEEERAYVNGVALDRQGKGHSCEVVMDQAQGQLSVMYRGMPSDTFMQQLLNRVDGKEAGSVSVAHRRLSFDCKSRPVFSHHSTTVSQTRSSEDMERGSALMSKVDGVSDENLADSIHHERFAGSGISTHTLDSGIGTFPLPDYSANAGCKSIPKGKAQGENDPSLPQGRHGSGMKIPHKAWTLERELSSLEEDYIMGQEVDSATLQGKIAPHQVADMSHEGADICGAPMRSGPTKNWTFPSLKGSTDSSDVYLGVGEGLEPVTQKSSFRRRTKTSDAAISHEGDPRSLPQPAYHARRAKPRGPAHPDAGREAGLELVRERPDDALSPAGHPQVLETPESLSDSLYDSLSSCGSQG